MTKLKTSNATFWVIFKHCASVYYGYKVSSKLVSGHTTQTFFNFRIFETRCISLIWVANVFGQNCSKFFMSHEHLRKSFFFQPEIMEDYLRKIPRKYEHVVISKIEIISNNVQIVNCQLLKRVFYFGKKKKKM